MEGQMNQDTLTEKSNFQSSELSDQELEQASGGGFQGLDKSHAWKRDSQGRVTHWKTDSGKIYHFTCPRCGRILHAGAFGMYYCDPCDDWFTKIGANEVIDQEA